MSRNKRYIRFLIWRTKRIPDKNFVLILSILIGLAAGLAAALLKYTVISIEDWLFNRFDPDEGIFIFLVTPLFGILLTVLFLKYIIRDNVGHGVPRILYAISKLDGSMRRHKIFSSLVGGSLTAGFGGSIGLESPIISTGASLGSNIGQFMRMSYKHKTLLIGCGAAGAMASIFTTPIAAVIFAFEVLMLELSTSALIPLLLASVTGAVTTQVLTAERYLVHFEMTQAFMVNDIPFYVLLGVAAGFVSVYFHFMHFTIIRWFSKIDSSWMRLLIGGSLLGVLIYLFPPLFSEGYDSIRAIISGDSDRLLNFSLFSGNNFVWTLIIFTFFLIVFKVIATTLTTEAGGVGGIFAPAAVMGGFSGFVLSRSINTLFPDTGLHESNFTLVGMASVLGGVLLAPLTAIFLITEMSSSYALIVPLMLSTSVAFLIAKTFNKHSIFTQTLFEKGDMFQLRDRAAIKQLRIKDLLEKDVHTISISHTLGDVITVIKRSRRNIFVVIDSQRTFIGLVLLDDLRSDMFDRDKYNVPISNYLHSPMDDEKVPFSHDVQEIINKFNRTGSYNMVVLDGNKYIGIVSRANVLKAYRENMISELDEY